MTRDEVQPEGPNLLSALPTMLWQRRWLIIIVTLLTTIIGIAVALLMAPVYTSSATVIIESQQLPTDIATQSGSDAIDQRIARARERVLSRMDLIRLIRANDLYPREQQSMPLSKVVEKMKDATTISGGGVGAAPGAPGANAISLTISYDYPDPVKAQIIAQQFVNRFLEVDAGAQADQASGSASILQDQANELQSKIAGIEGEINKIKSANGTLLTLGQMTTGNTMADAAQIDTEISRLQGENARLAATPSAVVNDAGVGQAEAQVRQLEARLSPSHPDVVAAKAQLEAARAAARQIAAQGSGLNPSLAVIQANRSQIAQLQAAKGLLLSQSAATQSAQAKAPAIAARVDALEKEADAYRDQYRVISGKAQNAVMLSKVQTEQRGERLTLADPPVVPDHPTRPNRPVLIAGGIAAGLALSLGLVLGIEMLLQPIRGTASLASATGELPLVVVPDLDRKKNGIKRFVEWRSRRRMARA